jgi:LacI family transcriptional regulator
MQIDLHPFLMRLMEWSTDSAQEKNVATIGDVAEKAGVSKTTVSHVLSGKRPVAPETKERVMLVIREMGFQPSTLARSLRIQRTHMIALIIPDITNPYYPMLARGLQDAIIDEGYQIFLCNSDGDWGREQEFIDAALQRQVDGIVFSSLHSHTEQFADQDTALISIGQSIERPDIDQVATDDRAGSATATRYLIQQGHTLIGMIAGPSDVYLGHERLAGYRDALQEANLPFDPALVAEGDFMRSGGAHAMQQLMSLTQRPTAIVCANDLMAIGALDTAHALKITVPDDIAIVGYDDIEAASLISPALTTVVNPSYDMGQVAGKLLKERMMGTYEGPGRRMIVPHRLVKRTSA